MNVRTRIHVLGSTALAAVALTVTGFDLPVTAAVYVPPTTTPSTGTVKTPPTGTVTTPGTTTSGKPGGNCAGGAAGGGGARPSGNTRPAPGLQTTASTGNTVNNSGGTGGSGRQSGQNRPKPPAAPPLIGTVTGLAADSFTLVGDATHSIKVMITAETTIKNLSDGSTATLADGQVVRVMGPMSATGVTAKEIVVRDVRPQERGFGIVADLADDSLSFMLTGPRGNTVTIELTDATTVTNVTDKSAATLANGQNVCVIGSYDDATKTVTASAIIVNNQQQKPQQKPQRRR